MPSYQKAFYLRDLRRFPDWLEAVAESDMHDSSAETAGGAEHRDTRRVPELGDNSIVYIREDFCVVDACRFPGTMVFDDVTEEWIAFCKNELKFAIPDWDAESNRARVAASQIEYEC